MDATFGWAGAGHHVDDYFSRQVGCGRFDMDDAFLGACFGQLHCDGILPSAAAGAESGDTGACHVTSLNCGAFNGGAGMATDPLAFLSAGTTGDDAFDVGLLDAALAFTREHGVSSNGGAMLSSYSGTTTTGGNISSGESNNYSSSGGAHDAAEVVSPTSIMSPTTAPPFTHASSSQPAIHHAKRKVTADEYPAAVIATTSPPCPPCPPRPGGGAKRRAAATSISFGQSARDTRGVGYEPDMEAMAQVKEMIYRAAAMRPVNLGPEIPVAAAGVGETKPRRKNVRISSDPQTVAARLRRERVSERLRVLQKLVPGGSKMDTASMLDEAASYLKFLKSQVQALETLGTSSSTSTSREASREQHYNYYNSGGGGSSNNPAGFLGFARRSSNISPDGYVNPNGLMNATSSKLL